MNLTSKRFGVYSESKNQNIIEKFIQDAYKLGWTLQFRRVFHYKLFFTLRVGCKLKPKHFWSLSGNNGPTLFYINLDTDYHKAKYMLQIIGKKWPKYNVHKIIMLCKD